MSDTIKQIIDISVRTRLVDRAAVEDPSGYDGGDVLFRLEEFAGKVVESIAKSSQRGAAVTHLKTGAVYHNAREAIDATNARNGNSVIIYERDGIECVRDKAEFWEKYELRHEEAK